MCWEFSLGFSLCYPSHIILVVGLELHGARWGVGLASCACWQFAMAEKAAAVAMVEAAAAAAQRQQSEAMAERSAAAATLASTEAAAAEGEQQDARPAQLTHNWQKRPARPFFCCPATAEVRAQVQAYLGAQSALQAEWRVALAAAQVTHINEILWSRDWFSPAFPSVVSFQVPRHHMLGTRAQRAMDWDSARFGHSFEGSGSCVGGG
jgi:hypothetical protein